MHIPSLSLAGSIFREAWSAFSTRWLDWILFWFVLTIFLNILITFIPNGLFWQIILICIIYGGFPLLLLGIYTINQRFETDNSRSLRSFFGWVNDKGVFLNACLLAMFYIFFYFGLALLAVFLDLAFNEEDSIASNFLLKIGGIAFLFFTWRMPALIAEGISLQNALKQSFISFLFYWKPISWLFVILHIPFIVILYGVILCTQELQILFETGQVIQQDMLLQTLWDNARIGLCLVFIGVIFQLSFWLIVLFQGYSPTFWKKLPLSSNFVIK